MPTYEVVRTVAGWHVRFRATNGRVIWTTEVYARRRAARAAIRSINAIHYAWIDGDALVSLASRNSWTKTNRPIARIRELDEREVS